MQILPGASLPLQCTFFIKFLLNIDRNPLWRPVPPPVHIPYSHFIQNWCKSYLARPSSSSTVRCACAELPFPRNIRISMKIHGLHTTCLYFIGSGNNYIPKCWFSFEFHSTYVNFLRFFCIPWKGSFALAHCTNEPHGCEVPPASSSTHSFFRFIKYWCKSSLAPPSSSSTHSLFNSY